MKNYNTPKVSKQEDQMEQGIMCATSGCTTCCPYNKSRYVPEFCPYAPDCPQKHTIVNGVVIASTCPKFGR